jgi:hypothetical protein
VGDAIGRRLECPRCGRKMQKGFLIDRGDHNAPGVPRWVEGAPEKSFWTGLKTKDRLIIPVMTYRCAGCGFLESYALPEAAEA